MRAPRSWLVATAVVAVAGCEPHTALEQPGGSTSPWFREGTSCMACHDRITTSSGEDVSFGSLWQASIMANSARDPYWQATVRREVADHPPAGEAIEDECSRCHMPMANETAHAAGQRGQVFANFPGEPGADPLAADGVACSLCHQITAARFGEPSSFTGGFVIASNTWPTIYGPYDLKPAQESLMRSALGAVPSRGDQVRRSELCATCHTLYTHTLDAQHHEVGQFPEQVPYLEWLHSDYRDRQSCQSCHMPAIEEPTPITSVAGTPRDQVARHDFRGANFLVLGMLGRHRAELAVTAPGSDLQRVDTATRTFLEQSSARVTLGAVTRTGTTLVAEVGVENLAGHKLPTAYPSRRAWLHVIVRDASGHVRFESGKLLPSGVIAGNDNDLDGRRFERHYSEIHAADQVQIYEAILGDTRATSRRRCSTRTGISRTTGSCRAASTRPRRYPIRRFAARRPAI